MFCWFNMHVSHRAYCIFFVDRSEDMSVEQVESCDGLDARKCEFISGTDRLHPKLDFGVD